MISKNIVQNFATELTEFAKKMARENSVLICDPTSWISVSGGAVSGRWALYVCREVVLQWFHRNTIIGGHAQNHWVEIIEYC